MSIQTNFSEENWDLISNVPQLVGLACATSANSGIFGTMKESMASVQGMMEGVKLFEGNELIAAIAPKPGSFSETKDKAMKQKEWVMAKVKGNIQKPEEMLELAKNEAVNAVSAVAECCSEEDVTDYKNYLVSIAEKVAASAKEGGFLGFGGTQISEGEIAFIEDLKASLGV